MIRSRAPEGARHHATRSERYRSGRNGGASKASCPVRGTWVRIPPSPPIHSLGFVPGIRNRKRQAISLRQTPSIQPTTQLFGYSTRARSPGAGTIKAMTSSYSVLVKRFAGMKQSPTGSPSAQQPSRRGGPYGKSCARPRTPQIPRIRRRL